MDGSSGLRAGKGASLAGLHFLLGQDGVENGEKAQNNKSSRVDGLSRFAEFMPIQLQDWRGQVDPRSASPTPGRSAGPRRQDNRLQRWGLPFQNCGQVQRGTNHQSNSGFQIRQEGSLQPWCSRLGIQTLAPPQRNSLFLLCSCDAGPQGDHPNVPHRL